tara:strand:- start:716 stop:2233 length:1518 start_codon:yes stop_codon:yes gene_type:complete
MNREIIFGPPGTGKTHTLLDEVKTALDEGVKPNKIGYMSFSRKANQEAVSRASSIEGYSLSEDDLPYFRTLHSLAVRMLGIDTNTQLMKAVDYQEFGEWIGLLNFDGSTTLDSTGMLINKNFYLRFIDLARYSGLSLEDAYRESPKQDLNWDKLVRIAEGLPKWKKNNLKYDFTDVIEEVIRKELAPDLDLLIVDEAQDLNNLQWRMIHLMEKSSKKILIAGDDDQAIYGFQGADVEHFLSLRKNSKVRTLKKSYRVPREVHEVANRVVKRLAHRQDKEWEPRDYPGTFNICHDMGSIDYSKGEFLILAQCNYMLDDIKELLEHQGYYYESKGNQLASQDLIASIDDWEKLRAGGKLDEESIKRIYSNFSVKKKQLKRGYKKGKTLFSDKLYSIDDLKKEHGLIEERSWDVAFTERDSRTIQYIKTMKANGEDLSGKPRISLSTIHGAKGGQGDNVVLLTDISYSAEQDYIWNPDPTHRLFYTGITRTRKNLFLVEPTQQRYYHV